MSFVRMFLVSMLFTVPALLRGCRASTKPSYSEPPVTLILADVSSSIQPQIRFSYAAYAADDVLPKLHPGERILLSPVGDSGSGTDAVPWLDVQLPAYPSQPQSGLNDDRASEARTCIAQFPGQAAAFTAARLALGKTLTTKLHTHSTASRTYLLDGIEMAARTLKEYHGFPTLLVFSDGIEDSDGQPALHFNRPGFWKPGRAQALIAMLLQQNRIPHLNGADIYFVGSPAATHQTAESMRSFWFAYFEAAGVSEENMHFGPRPRFRAQAVPLETNVTKFCHSVQ